VAARVKLDWQKTAQARARVRAAIEDALDEGLPRVYTPDVFKAKAGAVFQHVYERYARAA
jgi:type I restriction enzyme R subunit